MASGLEGFAQSRLGVAKVYPNLSANSAKLFIVEILE
jgi:hypothetical protein